MSSQQPAQDPAQDPPALPRRTSFVKVLATKVKSVLRKPDGSRRLSRLPGRSASRSDEQYPVPAEEAPAAKPLPPSTYVPKPVVTLATHSIPNGAIVLNREELFHQRAKELSDRYGLRFELAPTYTPPQAVRVEKPIRMRVRYICHQCTTFFGTTDECPACLHARCDDCARQPPRRTREERKASELRKKDRQNEPIFTPIVPPLPYQKNPRLAKPSRPCPTQPEVVFQKPRQRIHRTCHVCKTQFPPGGRVCGNCSHVRCTACPRDPLPKVEKQTGPDIVRDIEKKLEGLSVS